jgi:S1-C subfamily serine protease
MSEALLAFSDAAAARIRHAAPLVIGLDWGGGRLLSALLWADGVAVTSEQSLPETEFCTAILPGGGRLQAVPAGRDPSTNVAVLRLDTPGPRVIATTELDVGQLTIALGTDGQGGPRARLGIVETLGPTWQSQCGGRIDRLIRLDLDLPAVVEGGPVIDARGQLIGMSTFGPRNSVLVIPAATIERAARQLLAHGHVPRGWLGIGVQPVQLPRDTEMELGDDGPPSGLMVLSIADTSPAAGVLLPGDILLRAGPNRLATARALTALLGAETIGAALQLQVLRGGAIVAASVIVAGRPS